MNNGFEKVGDVVKGLGTPKEILQQMAKMQQGPDIPIDSCPICHGGRWVHPQLSNGKPDYSRTTPCKCSVAIIVTQQQERYLRMCKLPESSEGRTFATFRTDRRVPELKDALDTAKALAEETGDVKWLTLSGDADMGKTHLAVSICRRWLDRGRPARYAVVPLLLKELKDGFDRKGEEAYSYQFDFFCNVALLALDDLAMEKASEWAQEQLQTLIDYRYSHHLPLVVTTNKPVNALGKIDPLGRISSRLQREEWCKVIALEGMEYRFRRGNKDARIVHNQQEDK